MLLNIDLAPLGSLLNALPKTLFIPAGSCIFMSLGYILYECPLRSHVMNVMLVMDDGSIQRVIIYRNEEWLVPVGCCILEAYGDKHDIIATRE